MSHRQQAVFYLKKEVKIHLEHEFIFFHENLMLPKGTFLAVLVTQIPICFNKKL